MRVTTHENRVIVGLHRQQESVTPEQAREMAEVLNRQADEADAYHPPLPPEVKARVRDALIAAKPKGVMAPGYRAGMLTGIETVAYRLGIVLSDDSDDEQDTQDQADRLDPFD